MKRSSSSRTRFLVSLVIALTALLCLGSVTGSGEASGSSKPLVGAIRWDAWFPGETQAGEDLDDSIFTTYSNRQPIYGWYDAGSSGSTTIAQDAMDWEIRDAVERGLNFWAFDWYPYTMSSDNATADSSFLNYSKQFMQAYSAYLNSTSSYRSQLQYAFVLQTFWLWNGLPGSPTQSQEGYWWRTEWAPQLVDAFERSDYLKVSGADGRSHPLVYLLKVDQDYLGSEISWFKQYADDRFSSDNRQDLGTPVIISLSFNAGDEPSDSTLASLDLDGAGLYDNTPSGGPYSADTPNPPTATTAERCYSAQSTADNQALGIHSTTYNEPSLQAVDDPRPRLLDSSNPIHSVYQGWVQPATRSEWENEFKYAYDWASDPQNASKETDPPTILLYAWNELDEGGSGIEPTVQNGFNYLDAINDVVNGTAEPYVDEYSADNCAIVRHGPGWDSQHNYWSPERGVESAGNFSTANGWPGMPPLAPTDEPFENQDEISSTAGDSLLLTAGAPNGSRPGAVRFQVMATTGPSYGTMDIYLDGDTQPRAQIDLSAFGSETRHRQQVYTSPDLSPGQHSIVVAVGSGTVDVESIKAFMVPPGVSQPNPLITQYATSGTTLRHDFFGDVGFAFTPSQSITVTDLGRYFFAGDGTHPANSQPHLLQLLNAQGTHLADVWVQMRAGDQDASSFEYTHLPTPICLSRGATYYLFSGENDQGDWWYDTSNNLTADSSLGTITSDEYYYNGFQSLHSGAWTYGPINLKATAGGNC